MRRVAGELEASVRSLDDALDALLHRMDFADMRLFVSTIRALGNVGGKKSEILENSARIIRERFRLKRRIFSMTAEGRFTAIAISLAPFIVFLANFLFQPDTVMIFVQHPIGVMLILGMMISNVAGFLMIRKVTTLDF